jgi:hypothetical protein
VPTLDESDRRRYPRVHLDGRLGGRATVLADFRVITLSETGAMLEMEIPLAMGASCDLSLNLSHVSVDLRGRVVHIEKLSSGRGPYRVGVDFVRLQSLDRALLASFLDRERRGRPS